MLRAGSLPLAFALTLVAAEAMAQFPAAPGQFPSSSAPAPWPSAPAPAPGGFPSSAPAPAPFPGQGAAPAPFPGQGAAFPGAGGGPPPGGAGQPPPCIAEFLNLREAAQKRATEVRVASERKATPEQACKLIGVFTDAEAKVVRYVEKNAASCGIPADAVKGMRAAHGKSLELKKRVCTHAAQAPKGGGGPSLSESLGSSRLLDPTDRKQGTGTLDTLTGPVLTR
jgi:hypothetical protein